MPTPLYHPIALDKPRLRVGVMLDGWVVPAWIADVLVNVQGSGVAELTTVILNCEIPARRRWNERLIQLVVDSRTLLWRWYVRIDERLRRDFAKPFLPTDVRTLLSSAKTIEVVPLRSSFVDRFRPADVEAVNRDRLDVILRFGFGILRGDILSAATYGIWSYQHGDNSRYRGGPDSFWEMYEGNPITGTVLQILTDELGAGHVIYRSFGATRSYVSLLVNRHLVYRKSIPFVTRCLRRLYQDGASGIPPEPEAQSYTRALYRTPHNGHMLVFFMQVAWRMVIARLQNRLGKKRNHWFVAVGRSAAPEQKLAGKVLPLASPRGRFWADPMIVQDAERSFMFFEDYDYTLQRGHISVLEIDRAGRPGEPQTALQTDHHLSYPFVFSWHGTYFMVPETASQRAVQLYRCVQFPTGWEYVGDLLNDVRAADATICEHEGRWYLFTCVSEAGGSSWDELFLFVANAPIGPWSPHPMNPIVSDVRCARPAGALFRRDGVLYRPAQNSEKTYGHSLAVLEVLELSPQRYAERLAYRIEPDWLPHIHGCHTISMAGDLLALDGKMVQGRRAIAFRQETRASSCVF